MTMESLPTILFQVKEEDDLPFIFDDFAGRIYDQDIVVRDFNTTVLTNPIVQTLQYEGTQPFISPKTGNIQAPSDVALILSSLTVDVSSGTGTDSAIITLRASDTVDTADGTILRSYGTVLASASAISLGNSIILPENKFLTMQIVNGVNNPPVLISNVRTVERGINTRDLDPLLQ